MTKGRLASWSIQHPVSIAMLTSAIVVLGFLALGRLPIDLLPHLVHPKVQVRVSDPGVSVTIMEDRITRQLEEQLAITEDAIGIESSTREGLTTVNLYFSQGKNLDLALRDVSARLERARRFLPQTISQTVIDKDDLSQLPVMELFVSSPARGMAELRQWTDNIFAKRFLNVPGVAAVEVTGGVEREIQILPDQRRLAGLGLSVDDVAHAIQRGNEDIPAGRMQLPGQDFGGRAAGRLASVGAIANLPIRLPNGERVALSEVARVVDTYKDERVRVHLDSVPGVKMAILKQPDANTVEVVNQVRYQMAWAQANGLIPDDIKAGSVSDEAGYARRSLTNVAQAGLAGAALAMFVVYAFIGNIRGTLIIGAAIPVAILVTFTVMVFGGWTLNIVSLGGLALGVGMFIDNAIVMAENIARHRMVDSEKDALHSSVDAAGEITPTVIASTSARLVAVLPLLFVSGMVGLLFRELLFTFSIALIASLAVTLTVVPVLAARRSGVTGGIAVNWRSTAGENARRKYSQILQQVLDKPYRVTIIAVLMLVLSLPTIFSGRGELLPKMDAGRVQVDVAFDPGTSLDVMDDIIKRLEKTVGKVGDVDTVFSLVGGRVVERVEREATNRSNIRIQLTPASRRSRSSEEWITDFSTAVTKLQLTGVDVQARPTGVLGLNANRPGNDPGIRVQGADLQTLSRIGDELLLRLEKVKGLRNLKHSAQEIRQEFAINIDRQRASELGIVAADIGRSLQFALEGVVVSDFLDGDRSYDIRVRLPQQGLDTPLALGGVLLYGETRNRSAVYLRDVASVELVPSPATILHDNQRRVVEVTASLTGDRPLGKVVADMKQAVTDYSLPPGYFLYFRSSDEILRPNLALTQVLLLLALFLVFAVIAVRYESLRMATIIMIGVPLSLTGVAIGIWVTGLSISMPVWLGVTMLVGIVVNNSLLLVDACERLRSRGLALREAIIEAGRLRLRPILMTTLATVVGMLPLSLGIGEGMEILQPLAMTIIFGLSFSMLVSLLVIPVLYQGLNTTGGLRALWRSARTRP